MRAVAYLLLHPAPELPAFERLASAPDLQYDHAMGSAPAYLTLLGPEVHRRPATCAYLTDVVLPKVPGAWMRQYLDVPCCLLDPRLAELATHIPIGMKLHETTGSREAFVHVR